MRFPAGKRVVKHCGLLGLVLLHPSLFRNQSRACFLTKQFSELAVNHVFHVSKIFSLSYGICDHVCSNLVFTQKLKV